MSTTPLTMPHRIVRETVSTIVRCGEGRRECIVYVSAQAANRRRAARVIHPAHTATVASTEVGAEELDRIWDELAKGGETLVLQVHSHPGAAHHSGIDDRWPVLHRVGFPSLVLANFGANGLTGSHLAIYQGEGRWEEPPRDRWSEYLLVEPEEPTR